MTDRPKRKVRVRRRRRAAEWADGAGDAAEVTEFGCCLFEVVIGAAAIVLLIAVPATMLMG